MSEISELDGPELYLALIRKRITAWERAEPRSRTEHEQAEAFTRAFAELDAALKGGAGLPADWMQAKETGTKLTMADLARLAEEAERSPWTVVRREDLAIALDLAHLAPEAARQLAPGWREAEPRLVKVLGQDEDDPPSGSILKEKFGSHEVRLAKQPGESAL